MSRYHLLETDLHLFGIVETSFIEQLLTRIPDSHHIELPVFSEYIFLVEDWGYDIDNIQIEDVPLRQFFSDNNLDAKKHRIGYVTKEHIRLKGFSLEGYASLMRASLDYCQSVLDIPETIVYYKQIIGYKLR